MILSLLSLLSLLTPGLAQNLVCQEEVWLPTNSTPPMDDNCRPYDGSLVPNCQYFLNNVTSYYHVHEYDCSKFWECGPSGPCLFQCGECEFCGPNNRLSFDCRYQYPVGPVCDWPDRVNCTNDNPCTDDCCSAADCPGGVCIDGSCVLTTPGSPTSSPLTTTILTTRPVTTTTEQMSTSTTRTTTHKPTTGTTTTSDCPTECCSDEECEVGYCSDAGQCEGDCSSDGDCSGTICSVCENFLCRDPNCCRDEDCPDGTCQDGDCVHGECSEEKPCQGADLLCNLGENGLEEVCEYCDLETLECKPGCEDDDNCPLNKPTCSGNTCIHVDVNGIVNITVSTESCSLCQGSDDPKVEGGLKVHLEGDWGTQCQSSGLDNREKVDYDAGFTAFFDGTPDDDNDDDGLGDCKLADLNYGLNGGTAEWTGAGTWTGSVSDTVCIMFFDPDNRLPTCCCSLQQRSLAQGESSGLKDCECKI